MRSILRLLPHPFRRRLARWADDLGPQEQRIQRGPVQGVRILAPWTRRGAYVDGWHETHVARWLDVQAKPGMVVCDIGSHLGYFTLLLARKVGPSGKVYAFEPLAEHRRTLERTVELNGLRQVAVVPSAVGSFDGRASLVIPPNDAMGRLVSEEVSGDWPVHETRVTTLDTWAEREKLSRLDLIKLDVEGSELGALQGAEECLRRFRPGLVVEVHWSQSMSDPPWEPVRWLQDHDYRVDLLRCPGQPHESMAELLKRLHETPPPRELAAFHAVALPATSDY